MGSLSGMIGGLIGSGQSLPTVDIQNLLNTINSNSQYQQSIINNLPVAVQQQLQQYAAANTAAGNTYQNNITTQGNNFQNGIAGLYGPNSAAAQAENAANTQANYAAVPGTQDAVRNAMAATGGLARGNAGVNLAQPVVQAAARNSQSAANVNAQQTQASQGAQAQAMQIVNTMDDQMFTNLYGMSKAQAQQILQSGNAALSAQLSQLLTSSNNATQATLGAQGIAANNGYQNAVTRNAQQGAIWNGLADTGLQDAGVMSPSGGMNSPFSGQTNIWNAFGNVGSLFGGSGPQTTASGALASDGGSSVAGAGAYDASGNAIGSMGAAGGSDMGLGSMLSLM